MNSKTLVKTKIVLEDDGKSLVTYFWKKTFWIFGHWYPFGTTSSFEKISNDKIKRINDNEMSSIIYEKFIRGHK